MLPHNISTAAIAGSHMPSTFHPSPPPFGSDEAALLQQSPAGLKHHQPISRPHLPPSPPSERPPSPAATPLPADSSAVLVEPVASTPLNSNITKTPAPALATPSASSSPLALTAAEIKGCKSVLISLQRHQSSWPFLVPVDPVATGALDYFNVITRPMDLSTVSAKLDRGEYGLVQEFAADVMLMFDNCYLYNPPTNDIHKLGQALESHFSLHFCKIFPALTAFATRGGSDDGKRKRKIKPPKVFEIDEPSKRAKGVGSAASSRKGSISGSRKLSSLLPAQLAHLGASGVDVQIEALSSYLQTMTDQLAALSGQAAAAPKRKAGKKADSDDEDGVVVASEKTVGRSCAHCQTFDTPMWRRGPFGVGTLCNKCGVKWMSGKLVLPGPPPPARKLTKKAPSKKAKKASVVPLTWNEKQELVAMFDVLNPEETQEVLEIIGRQPGMSGDVVEIDMDALEEGTLRELYVFAKGKTSMKGVQPKVQEVGDVKPRSVTQDEDDDDESGSGSDDDSSGSESD